MPAASRAWPIRYAVAGANPSGPISTSTTRCGTEPGVAPAGVTRHTADTVCTPSRKSTTGASAAPTPAPASGS